MAASGSQVGSGDRPVPVEEIFRLLESTDLTIVDDIHQLILENLSQGAYTVRSDYDGLLLSLYMCTYLNG